MKCESMKVTTFFLCWSAVAYECNLFLMVFFLMWQCWHFIRFQFFDITFLLNVLYPVCIIHCFIYYVIVFLFMSVYSMFALFFLVANTFIFFCFCFYFTQTWRICFFSFNLFVSALLFFIFCTGDANHQWKKNLCRS